MSEGGGGDAVEVTRDKDSDEAANVGRGYALVEGEGGVEGAGDADEEVGADAANARTSSLPELLHLEKPQGDGWIEFEKPILYLYAGKGPYVSRDLMQFPVSHPDDGYIDVVIQERVSEPIFRLC